MAEAKAEGAAPPRYEADEEVECVGGAASAPAPAAAAPKKAQVQATLAFGRPDAKPVATGSASRGADRSAAADTVIAAAASKKAASPPKACIKSGWLEGHEGIKARSKGGTREIVVVCPVADLPLEFWQRANGRKRVPTKHPVVIVRGYMAALKDGKSRWEAGRTDLLCLNCFQLVRSPPTGEENLKTHFESLACGAASWATSLRLETKKIDGEFRTPRREFRTQFRTEVMHV